MKQTRQAHEHQHVEWKESWRDEYLKWVCGFANADGGVLVIGRNDKGAAVGVENARKLLADIPNKVRDILGVMVDVNLREVSGLDTLEAWISYDGLQRVETLPVPEPALREAVLNAIVHKEYVSGVPVQISVYPDQLMIWNPGHLPPNWTVERLLGTHASHPFNIA